MAGHNLGQGQDGRQPFRKSLPSYEFVLTMVLDAATSHTKKPKAHQVVQIARMNRACSNERAFCPNTCARIAANLGPVAGR